VNASCTYYVGDALTVMRTLPAGSVDLVLSSPAFLGLRSYLPPGHPDKAKEMGSEPTPGEFIDALLNVVEEADRVLTPHGSLVIELGDTYAGSGGAGGDYAENGLREGQQRFDGSAKKERRSVERYRNPMHDGGPLRDRAADTALGIRPKEVRWRGERDGWPLDKSLCLIPELLRFALAYGFNPLTGRQTPRRLGVVLDPFAGTGTTGLVATGHGRSAVLIDLDERNLHLARERIGMFLTEGVMEASA
jgi:DNA modification methylase